MTSLFAEAPSEPRDLEIIKFDKTSVTLKWKAPTDDNGNPIQGMSVSDWSFLDSLNVKHETIKSTNTSQMCFYTEVHVVVCNL